MNGEPNEALSRRRQCDVHGLSGPEVHGGRWAELDSVRQMHFDPDLPQGRVRRVLHRADKRTTGRVVVQEQARALVRFIGSLGLGPPSPASIPPPTSGPSGPSAPVGMLLLQAPTPVTNATAIATIVSRFSFKRVLLAFWRRAIEQ